MEAAEMKVAQMKGTQLAAPDRAPVNEGAHFRPACGRRSLWTGWPLTATFGVLATVLSWRAQAWRPVFAGLSSWQVGVTFGFLQHLQWGPQMLFTFGPFGFVEDILPFSHLAAGLGLLYALAIRLGLAALIGSALRESWGLLPAGIATWATLAIAANLLEAPELGLAVALGLALASFRTSPPVEARPGGHGERKRLALLAVLAGLAAFQMLVEINVGLISTGLAALSVIGRSGRTQALAAAVAAYAGVFVVALTVSGQSFGNVPSYLHGSLSVTAGYASAMSLSDGRQAENWLALVDVVLLATIFALALRGRPNVEKVAISLGLTGWFWDALKEGFVRHDLHDLTFFGLALAALCLVRLPRSLVPVQAFAVMFAAVASCVANAAPPLPLHSPVESVSALAEEIGDILVPRRWPAVERTARRQEQKTGDALSAGLVSRLRGSTLAVEPLEDAMTFAYPGLRWDPEPVLQAYSAYTSYLDHLDAAFLSSSRAPAHILYRPDTVSGRNPAWDPPTTVEAMYCHYVEASVSDNWLVLARVADRCQPPRLIGRAKAHFGEMVTVPSVPGQMVVATFSLSTPLAATVEGLLLKPPPVDLTTRDGRGASFSYNFVAGTAGDDHVLELPTSLGYSPAFTPSAVRRLYFSGGGWAPGQGRVDVSFYAVTLRRR
jgi:hypothetical protein